MREFTPEEKRVIKRIREVIDEVSGEMGIKVDRVILFGSRVRGDYREDSDWDILVVVEEDSLKREFEYELRKRFVYELDIASDIIIVSKRYYDENKNILGDISGIASTEGVLV